METYPLRCNNCVWLEDPDPNDGRLLGDWSYKCANPEADGGHKAKITYELTERCEKEEWREDYYGEVDF